MPLPQSQLQENDAYNFYQGLNSGNDFKHRETYKILARELRWANLRDDGLNNAENVLRNIVRRTSDNLSEVPDSPPILQSVGPNSELDGLLYETGSSPIDTKLFRKNLATQKALDGVVVYGSDIQTMLDELRLEKRQAKEEKERRRAEANS
ncbi:hypothetical protein GIB67_010284 [Kingdonia uniflora]|uniref:Uncharacterized protein n=1 Tax=Kingdonia uniflora TaxID=39325 RepID=A0A7J7MA26_9MAGN|nr:hypothetical protein GIB67_010284 [Kingdonia uniflora]